jgi:hypothetical protein
MLMIASGEHTACRACIRGGFEEEDAAPEDTDRR